MDPYSQFKFINQRLARGHKIFFSQKNGEGSDSHSRGTDDRPIHYPEIGIYTGTGTSHSWLWFVEIFDRMGFYKLTFLDEQLIKNGGLRGLDVLAMSGGDTFAIAEGLGQGGAQEIEGFIREGGLYLGSCAGAYLPLNSSKEHLNLFNYVPAKITNLTKILPEAAGPKEKFCTPYGCSFIFHPVREDVRITTNGFKPFAGVKSVLAPLYGGPPMTGPDSSQILATYSGFTNKTLFLVDKEIAQDTLLGKAAVIRKKMGEGHLYLFGPHFEHPRFQEANKLLADAIYWDVRGGQVPEKETDQDEVKVGGGALKDLVRDIKREVSNSRIVAAGMETMSVRWMIGKKVYEPAKIRVFIEAIWQRIKPLERMKQIGLVPGKDALMVQYASETTTLLREMRRGINQGQDTLPLAKKVFKLLNRTSTLFLDIYFRARLRRIYD